jgi:hypothetical protein
VSPYIAGGYSVVLVSLSGYALALSARERRARRRLGIDPTAPRPAPGVSGEQR